MLFTDNADDKKEIIKIFSVSHWVIHGITVAFLLCNFIIVFAYGINYYKKKELKKDKIKIMTIIVLPECIHPFITIVSK